MNFTRSSLKSTLVCFLLIAAFFLSTSMQAQSSEQTTEPSSDRVYIKIEVKGLACPYCAFGMENELKKISGVDKVDIELTTGLAYISTPEAQKPSPESLKEIVVDAGFTPGEIEYKHTPFDKQAKDKG